MFDKIDISKIISTHIETLQNDNSKLPGLDDIVTFLILPITVAWLLLDNDIFLNDAITNIVITALSILIGLLINVIVLIFDIVKRHKIKKIKNEVLRQLLANISFTILVSIVSIIFTILTYSSVRAVHVISTGIVYFLLTNFLCTVLMILKRMYQLFNNELNEKFDVND